VGFNKRGWQAKIADLGVSRMLPVDAVSFRSWWQR
jgi:hypothetical protein